MSNERLRAFREQYPHIRCSGDPVEMLGYARDCWPLLQIRAAFGRVDSLPDFVAWPTTIRDIKDIHKFARSHQIPLIPFGAGSGVCGGAYAIRGGIMIDVKPLNQILHIDFEANSVRVQAGKNGQLFEEELNQAGFSCGHFPSSMYCSTVGGWVAARGAGQCSTQYGKIEDMLLAVTWVDQEGQIQKAHRSHIGGPALLDMIVGSEGTLGTIAEVELAIFPLPEERRFLAYTAASLEEGLRFGRQLLQKGVFPSVFRMYDPLDTLLVGKEGQKHEKGMVASAIADIVQKTNIREKVESLALKNPSLIRDALRLSDGSCLVILMFEGTADKVGWEMQLARQMASSMQLVSRGDAPGWAWLDHRYHVSFKQSKVYKLGAFVDTMEVSAPFERLPKLYDQVMQALRPKAMAMAHFSHLYREGGAMYVTFAAARTTQGETEELYMELWRRGLDAVLRNGGSLAHHHGVGLLKARWMPEALGGGMTLAQSAKDHFDTDGIFNPGKLGFV